MRAQVAAGATREAVLTTTTSRDGTVIGSWRSGQGRPLVLVHGSTADHTRWRPVLPLLEALATVYAVDRRGRGASGDAPDYVVEREFADIASVIDAIGGPVDVLAHSFGALCALEAALLTSGMRRLVLYEAPVLPPPRTEADDRLEELLEQGRRAELIEVFFREIVGADAAEVDRLKTMPSWPARVAAAHTVVRERLIRDPYRFDPQRFSGLSVPTLLLAGGDSPPFLQESTAALAAALPGTRVVTLEGQQHFAMDSVPERFAAEVGSFLRSRAS